MAETGQFFLQAMSIAIAAALFVAALAIFFDRVMPRIPGKSSKNAKNEKIDQLLCEDDCFVVLLHSGQTYQDVRYESALQLDADEGWPGQWFAVMRHRDGRKVLIRLDAIRAIEQVPGREVERETST